MSRKVALTLAAATVMTVAALASTPSHARSVAGFGGHGFGSIRTMRGPSRPIGRVFVPTHGPRHLIPRRPGVTLCVLGRPCPPRPPVPPIWVWHHHHHHHWVFRGGRWIDDVVEAAPVETTAAVDPAPCSCLTKTYTPTGLVVFADVCTKESASAPATEDHADATPVPNTSGPADPQLAQPTAPQQN
jgi:hypothetical protein